MGFSKEKKMLPHNCLWTWTVASVLPWVHSLLGCPGDLGCTKCHHKANSDRWMGRFVNQPIAEMDGRSIDRYVHNWARVYIHTLHHLVHPSGEPGYPRLKQGLPMQLSTEPGTCILSSHNFTCIMRMAQCIGEAFKMIKLRGQVRKSSVKLE